MGSKTAWRINAWISFNVCWILWAILTIASLLQQFPATEPLVVGFFWINLFFFFLGIGVGGKCGNSNPTGIWVAVVIQILGIVIQVVLVAFFWKEMVWLDTALRSFRSAAVSPFGSWADHLLPLRLVWGAVTLFFFCRLWRRGHLFQRIGRRPW